MRRGWIATGAVTLVLTAGACSGPPGKPPHPLPGGNQFVTGPSGFAYAGATGIRVVRGAAILAEVAVGSGGSGGYVSDAEWTADGSRFVAATGTQLFSVDFETGATVAAACRCASIAVAAGKVFVLDRYRGTDLAVYDAATLRPQGTMKPDLGQAMGLLAIDGAGDRVVTFQITADGARPFTDVVVFDPGSGATTRVGRTNEIGTPGDTAYTPRGWRGGPMFAYITNAASGASEGVASVAWFDPTGSAPQVVTNDRQLRAETPDVPASSWNSGRQHLWWAADGTLRTTAWTWSCATGVRPAQPGCVELIPHSQWRYDGTDWTMTDERDLDTAQETAADASLELTRAPGNGLGNKQLTLIEGGNRSVLATDVRNLWTRPLPPAPAGSTGSQALAERFAPTVWLHEEEKNFPADASDFIRGSALRFDHGDHCKDLDGPVATNLDEHKLGRGGYRHQIVVPVGRLGTCAHPEGGETQASDEPARDRPAAGKGFYLDPDDAIRPGNRPGSGERVRAPVYWEYVPSKAPKRGAYVYWFFYAYNDFKNNHEGDWERIAVQVEGDRPIGVAFWKHKVPVCYVPWENMETSGKHPVTFSASGSHASYARPGDYSRHDTKQWGTDRTNKGTEWNTSRRVLALNKQPWYGYRGIWGDLARFDVNAGVTGPYPNRDASMALTTEKCPGEVSRTPEVFIGSWKSSRPVKDPTAAEAYGALLRITAGAADEKIGTAAYETDHNPRRLDTSCSSTLTLVTSTPDSILVREVRSSVLNPLRCARSGSIKLTRTPTGLHYDYVDDNGSGNATADLIRE